MTLDKTRLPTIYFIRHGETAWNHERRIQGQIDIPLNDTGRDQAKRIAALLSQVVPDPSDYDFFASPLSRARDTMGAVLSTYGLDESVVRFDDRIKEISFGEVEGKSWHDLHAKGIHPEVDPEFYHDWRPENGESYADATQRVVDWAQSLTRPSIVVAHGGISRILRGLVFDLPKREIVQLKVSQNKFYRIHDGGLDWFDARQKAA